MLLPFAGFAQEEESVDLNVDTLLNYPNNFYDTVDYWIAFPINEEEFSYAVGYHFLDPDDGFIFYYTGSYQINDDGSVSPFQDKDLEPGSFYSLEKETSDVVVLDQKWLDRMELPRIPAEVQEFEYDRESIEYLKDIGWQYNHVDACENALVPLLKAYEMDPHYEGLEFELAFAYNHLGRYEEAIVVLDKAVANNPEDFWFYRELGFAYRNTGDIEKAEKIYLKGISMSDSDFQKSEMAVNMCLAYWDLKNREKYDEWAVICRKYGDPEGDYVAYLNEIEANWDED